MRALALPGTLSASSRLSRSSCAPTGSVSDLVGGFASGMCGAGVRGEEGTWEADAEEEGEEGSRGKRQGEGSEWSVLSAVERSLSCSWGWACSFVRQIAPTES